jgi:hypothetical protein
MLKTLGYMLAGLTTLSASPTAFAYDHGHVEGKALYSCNMDFRATGKSIYIGLGWTDIHGKGTISCYDLLHGTTVYLPIKVKAKGPGAGLGVTGLVLSGAVAGVGVEKGPENLIGHYVAARANAAAGVGAGAAAGLRVSKGGITIDVSAQAESGLGVGVDLLWLNIESDGETRTEGAAAPTQPVGPAQAPAPQEKSEAVAAPVPAPPEAAPAASTAIAASEVKVTLEKTNIVYLQEGQPLQILDGKGKIIQTIYLKAQSPK